ncbi:2TM domain-containing protein [Rhodoferax saidenbachensis]|uniref:2TM domain-containing protein n=1 Tax=Rhodoferax saidenbachensis TaxID=1484693 RepID=A0A1P8KC97_9BURK|nr:2TM domain-containing protein [Rhodoferax saidenbachensis]APW43585.1 hypothetical protein RS694_14280 [Rhodoferax saidenbachensis]
MHTTLNVDEAEQLARKRAGAKLGWITHATVYLLVNALVLLTGWSGHHGHGFPILGWGLALLIHGAVVFLAAPGDALHDRLLQRERARLQGRLDPW